jgi:hypothetical protein
MAYNLECECVLQTGSWQCSAASAAWVLQSMGIPWGQDDVVNWLGVGRNISPDLGLYEGSGRMLAELFQSQGLDGQYGPLGWGDALAMAGRQPFCMSGGRWYHWSAVRKTDGQGLYLANPAPNWCGVQEYMDYDQWRTLGPWNAAWVNVPLEEDPAVIADLEQTIERLRAELAMREQRDEALINMLGYIHGDVVQAFRTAHDGLENAIAAAQAAASLPPTVRDELTGHLDAVEAATNTLEAHTQP